MKFRSHCVFGENVQYPSEIVFLEQSYSSLHSGPSGQSLALDHFCRDIDDPFGDFCGAIADPCAVAIPEAIGNAGANVVMPIIARLTKHRKTYLNIIVTQLTLGKYWDNVIHRKIL